MATVVEAVAPTPIATAPAVIGPITGTISTSPANAPIRIQYGSPIAQNASDRTVATTATRISWPRTNAPSFRSMSVHVSRIRFRFGRGTSEQTKPIARSRSKIQYAALANTKKIPITTSNAFRPNSTPGRTRLDADGSSCSRFCNPTRSSCCTPVELSAA